MQIQKPLCVWLFAAAAVGYGIQFYSSSDCSTGNFATCGDIGLRTCCVSRYVGLSVLGTGLDSTGVPDIIVAYGGGGCGKSCNSGGGNPSECVTCPGIITGASIETFGSKRNGETQLEAVYTDEVGIYDATLGAHRMFYINSSVPAEVVASLITALYNHSKVADLDSGVFKYEVL